MHLATTAAKQPGFGCVCTDYRNGNHHSIIKINAKSNIPRFYIAFLRSRGVQGLSRLYIPIFFFHISVLYFAGLS